MLRAKLIFIYTVLTVFVAVSIVGILGAIGIVPISNIAIVSALLGPVIGIVATVSNAKHIFEDPDAVVKIKQEHADAMLERQKQSAEEEIERQKKSAAAYLQLQQHDTRTKNEYEAKIKHLEAEVSRWQRTALSNQNRPRTISARPVPPIVGGDATTQK